MVTSNLLLLTNVCSNRIYCYVLFLYARRLLIRAATCVVCENLNYLLPTEQQRLHHLGKVDDNRVYHCLAPLPAANFEERIERGKAQRVEGRSDGGTTIMIEMMVECNHDHYDSY